MTSFTLNGKPVTVSADPDTPLLWVIRDELGLKGTKFGCGASFCGACTVEIGGNAIRSCSTPVGKVAGEKITTIESLGTPEHPHAIQAAWIKHEVPQCGYCQSGQMMSAHALLTANPHPNDEQINEAMSGNICRCGTYPRIVAAIKDAAAAMRKA